jgi:DNA-binding NtrC family response regulator
MRPQTRPTVLVVDDEQRLRDVLVRGIAQMGYGVAGSPNGEDALRQMRDNPRGVVIVDLNLPGIDGMTLFEKLRRGWPAVQVIVLTGFGDLDTAKQAIRLDVVDFLTKPTHLGELEQALSRAWQRIDDAAGLDVVQLPEPTRDEISFEHDDDDDGEAHGLADAPKHAGAVPKPGESLDALERRHILDTLAKHDGNRRATADALGISLRTLYYRLSQYQKEGHL